MKFTRRSSLAAGFGYDSLPPYVRQWALLRPSPRPVDCVRHPQRREALTESAHAAAGNRNRSRAASDERLVNFIRTEYLRRRRVPQGPRPAPPLRSPRTPR